MCIRDSGKPSRSAKPPRSRRRERGHRFKRLCLSRGDRAGAEAATCAPPSAAKRFGAMPPCWRSCNADPRCNARNAASPLSKHGPLVRTSCRGARKFGGTAAANWVFAIGLVAREAGQRLFRAGCGDREHGSAVVGAPFCGCAVERALDVEQGPRGESPSP